MRFDNGAICLLLSALAATRSGASADRLGDLTSAVRGFVTTEAISSSASRVVVGDVTCDVYGYADANADRDAADDREIAARFYACVNCVFAGWLQDQLVELVARVPTLYRPAALSAYDGRARALFGGGSSSSDEGVGRVARFAERFANVLFNFADAYGRASAVDADFLRTLLSFGFAADHLKAAYGGASGETASDRAAIVRMLRTVNAAQKYRALNCDVSAPFYDHPVFYGYTRPRPAVVDGPGVARFLRHARPAGLETHLERCGGGGGRMLLRDVLDDPADAVARELHFAHLRVECPRGKGPLPIGARLAEKVARTHDLDVILWYQKVVYDALLKMLCTKAVAWLRLPYATWPVEIRNGFEVLSFMWAESTDAPPALARVLSLLAAGKPLNNSDAALAKKVVSEFVQFQTLVPPETPLYLPPFNVNVLASSTVKDLEPFMDVIINRVDDYKCFVRLFRTLNADYRKYYMPHARNIRKVYQFVNQEACEISRCKSGFAASGSGSEASGSGSGASGSGSGASVRGSAVGGKKLKTSGNMPEIDTRELKPERSEITENWKKKSPVGEPSKAVVPDSRGSVTEIQETLDATDVAEEICLALIGMYQYCFETLLELNDCRAAELREPGAGKSCLPEVGKNIGAVVRYAYILSASSLRDHCINKMSFDLMTMQMFAGNRLWQDGLFDELQRHLYIIMAELNECGLQFCRPPKYNYLLFNNIDLSSTGQHGRFHAWWNGFMQTVGLDPNAKLPKLDVLNEEYRINAGVFERYRNSVKLYWKGEMMSVDDIFRSVSYTLSNPEYAYALYDVYFGFSVAAMYYETLLLFQTADIVYKPETMQPHSVFQVFNVFVKELRVDENNFPPVYETLITHYNNNVSETFDRVASAARFQIKQSVSTALNLQFEALGIFIDMDHCDLSDAHAASEFKWDKIDSFMSFRVNKCVEIVNRIQYSALKVKLGYTQFVNYFINSIPGLSFGR